MNCDELRSDLSAFADGELPHAGAARIEAHVASCFECREVLASWRTAARSLRAEDETRDPAAAIVNSLRTRPRRRPVTRLFFRLGVAAAVVAAAALFLGPVQAQREAALIVDLDSSVRASAAEDLAAVEAAQLELLALFMSLRALELDSAAAAEVEREASDIAERAAAIKSKLRDMSESLERERMFSASDAPGGGHRAE